ncbi:hypothetical protein LTR02_007688 [Friedmanniomyces endolithicus]|nr:hypothetical protein LTR75_012853 [Friedmanniomyces endolithicus]KAK0831941.1 hypothetical protein LTR03_015325 [Friedmanniomyces endolithicus]KAK0864084.1 hypothetical protein LTS02_006174 [Friedmanniomyces endolithicus]KAK0903270.1 hypothetical protein LTR02_007688 [Friedmanniomyces endolithicus]
MAMAQTASTQLGPNAIAHHDGVASLPAPAPALHHLDDSDAPETKEQDDLIFHDLPPFPPDVPTAPLLRLNLARLLNHDGVEEAKLWDACQNVGFFYLDLRGGPSSKRDSVHSYPATLDGDALLRDAAELFELGREAFELPTEEKQSYDLKDKGSYYGYKGLGQGVVDAKGTRDANEFYNVSKDDVSGIGERLPAPEVLQKESNRQLLAGFCRMSHAVVAVILGVLNEKLGLPEGRLAELHRLEVASGDQVRWVRSPPQPTTDAYTMSLGEHTDFGSVTVLFNRLGGLQILPPDSEEWQYVKPLRGHAVVNLGDAMVKFTAGVLRSNIHRVVNPPGQQASHTRMSLVYFARPEDEVKLKVLEGSQAIEAKRKELKDSGGLQEEEDVTAKEWILRRAMGRRAGGDWKASEGTEAGRSKLY